MDDAALVSIVNCSSELLDKPDGFGSWPRLAELIRQASACHQLQREERQSVDLADFKDLHDIGMLQPSNGVGFRAKARRLFRQATQLRQQNLQSHPAVRPVLPGFVNYPHSPPTQFLEDLIAGKDRKGCYMIFLGAFQQRRHGPVLWTAVKQVFRWSRGSPFPTTPSYPVSRKPKSVS